MFCCEHTQPAHGGAKIGSLGGSDACAEIHARYVGLWIEICQRWRSGVAGVHKF